MGRKERVILSLCFIGALFIGYAELFCKYTVADYVVADHVITMQNIAPTEYSYSYYEFPYTNFRDRRNLLLMTDEGDYYINEPLWLNDFKIVTNQKPALLHMNNTITIWGSLNIDSEPILSIDSENSEGR